MGCVGGGALAVQNSHHPADNCWQNKLRYAIHWIVIYLPERPSPFLLSSWSRPTDPDFRVFKKKKSYEEGNDPVKHFITFNLKLTDTQSNILSLLI